MNKCIFVSFASTNMKDSLDRIGRQAHSMGVFDDVYLYTEEDLPEYGKTRCKEIIEKTGTKKGYAYWCWKSIIINDLLAKMQEGEVLIYSDAGTHLNNNGVGKLKEYIDMAIQNDIWVVELEDIHPIKKWCKKDTIDYFVEHIVQEDSLSEFMNLLNEPQLEAGTIILIKNEYTVNLMKQWEYLMSEENLHLFDDSPSVASNYPEFKEHRHDQSVLSLLLKANHYSSTDTSHFWASTEEGWRNLRKGEPFLHLRDVCRSSEEKKHKQFSVGLLIKKIRDLVN